MNKDEYEQKKFLQEQFEWCKERDAILEEIEIKLHKMKKIAQYALEHELTAIEIEQLNGQLNELKREVILLERQLHSVVH